MGSSTKKKNDKKKDFQKPKLKVGKAKSKASNHTDTSFKAKSIALSKQSLSVAAPSVDSQFYHHASMLRSKADSQRRDSLAFLTSVALARDPGTNLPEPAVVLIPKLQPMILDSSNGVRQQLLKLFKCFTAEEVDSSVEQILLYSRAGMSHLAADIRLFAVEVLEWLLSIVGNEVVSCAGGWVKTLQCFIQLLGWEKSKSSNSWSTSRNVGTKNSDNKTLAKQLGAFTAFINTGIGPRSPNKSFNSIPTTFPYVHLRQHMLPERSKPFAHLKLFGAPHEVNDEENGIYEDREDRQLLFVKRFQSDVENGVEIIKREGGELGRAAAGLSRAIAQGLEDYLEA